MVQFSVPDSLRPLIMTCCLTDNFLLMCVFLYIMYIRVYIVYITAQGVYRRRYSSLYLIHYASWVMTIFVNMCIFLYNVYKGVYSVYKGPGGVQKTVQFSVPDSLRLLGHDHLVL